MKKFALATLGCVLALAAGIARGQQVDFAIGGGTLVSTKPNTASQLYIPPGERGGTYPSISLDYIGDRHLGLNAELAFREKQGFYNGYQGYRPVLYDFNLVYAPTVGKDVFGRLMAGVGGERVIFYNRFSGCNPGYPVCLTYVSSNHLLGHVGGELGYYFWHNFFIRPEAHLYLIRNNMEFHSDFVGRGSVSIGYTFGRREQPATAKKPQQ